MPAGITLTCGFLSGREPHGRLWARDERIKGQAGGQAAWLQMNSVRALQRGPAPGGCDTGVCCPAAPARLLQPPVGVSGPVAAVAAADAVEDHLPAIAALGGGLDMRSRHFSHRHCAARARAWAAPEAGPRTPQMLLPLKNVQKRHKNTNFLRHNTNDQ